MFKLLQENFHLTLIGDVVDVSCQIKGKNH